MTAFKEIRIGAYVLRFWSSDNGWMCGITPEMMDAIEQAEKQEPVAMQMDVIVVNLVREGINKHRARELAEHFIKHTTPQPQQAEKPFYKVEGPLHVVCQCDKCKAQPQREWVGLTDEDKQIAFDDTQEASGGFWEFAHAIEAKLKEKNT